GFQFSFQRPQQGTVFPQDQFLFLLTVQVIFRYLGHCFHAFTKITKNDIHSVFWANPLTFAARFKSHKSQADQISQQASHKDDWKAKLAALFDSSDLTG
ncbi:MAG: hypothetical protein HC867_06445, partial [Bacteroidia bacterium]|nr:hypothetical protein [Bacteroidia bacterium]